MKSYFHDNEARRKYSGILGLITSALIFVNSGHIITFILMTVLGTSGVILLVEFSYYVWKKLKISNKYLKYLATSLIILAAIAVFSLLFIVIWSYTGGWNACMMTGEKQVENRFTGECKLVERCGNTAWYYENGCSEGKTEISNQCRNVLRTRCKVVPGGHSLKKPEICSQQELPEKYSGENNTLNCP